MKKYWPKKLPGSNELLSLGGVALVLIALLLIGSQIDISVLSEYIRQAGVWAPIVFILAKASTIIFAPLTGTPLYVLIGTIFGVKEGILYAFLGDLIGFSTLFWLSRLYGMSLINSLVGGKEVTVVETIQKQVDDVLSLLRTCVIFFWFPEAVVAAAGLGRLNYATVMLIFMPIYTIAASILIILSAHLLG